MRTIRVTPRQGTCHRDMWLPTRAGLVDERPHERWRLSVQGTCVRRWDVRHPNLENQSRPQRREGPPS
jgi:hypothetical protein